MARDIAQDVRIGVVDSGIPRGPAAGRLVLGRSFRLDDGQEVAAAAAGPDLLGHASAIAGVIVAACPEVRLAIAQIFFDRLVTTAAQAAAVDWLADEGVAVASMSFGLAADRAVLRDACARAVARGLVLVASAPARGDPVFPASYPEVVAVTGDARCAAGELSALDGPRAEFGAPVRAADGGAGASIGAAHVTAEIARYLAASGDPALDSVRSHLRSRCRYVGPEHRTA